MATQEKRQIEGICNALFDLLADTAACVRFFSRLPVPRLSRSDDPAALPDFSRIAKAIPIAGIVVALPAALLCMLGGMTDLPPLATGFLVAGMLAAVTGALHEDGLSDVVDGFFGGHTRERRLEIMKDSRVGAFGALALVLATGLRASLIAGLLERYGPYGAAVILLGVESLSRTLVVWQWSRLPAARPEGLGGRFGRPDSKMVVQAGLICLVLLLPALFALPFTALLLALVLAGTGTWGIGKLSMSKIGGYTGDVLGAIQQVSGLAFLLGVLLIA